MSEFSAIEQELLQVTALKPKKNEDRQKYLTRLMLAVTKLSDPDWEGLTKDAQEWTNGGAEAHKAGSEVEDFEDFVEEAEDEEVDEEQVEGVEKPQPVKAKTNGNGVAKTKSNGHKEEVKEIKKSPSVAPRKVSACHMIKKIVVKKPTITVAELSEQLKQDGLKVSDVTIATLRSDLRDTLRVLNELGIAEFVL